MLKLHLLGGVAALPHKLKQCLVLVGAARVGNVCHPGPHGSGSVARLQIRSVHLSEKSRGRDYYDGKKERKKKETPGQSWFAHFAVTKLIIWARLTINL